MNSLSPEWKESFSCKLKHHNTSIFIDIFDCNHSSVDKQLGHAEVDIAKLSVGDIHSVTILSKKTASSSREPTGVIHITVQITVISYKLLPVGFDFF